MPVMPGTVAVLKVRGVVESVLALGHTLQTACQITLLPLFVRCFFLLKENTENDFSIFYVPILLKAKLYSST